jgi:hypothetical protein
MCVQNVFMCVQNVFMCVQNVFMCVQNVRCIGEGLIENLCYIPLSET